MFATVMGLAGCGERVAEEAVAARFANPDAASFQSVERRADAVCGEVNVRGSGGTDGYTRFVVQEPEGRVSIAPRTPYTASDLTSFDATCAMLGGRASGLDRQACTLAAKAREDIRGREAFEATWKRLCAP